MYSSVQQSPVQRKHQPRTCFFFFSHTNIFQLLDKPWSQVSSFLPLRFLPSSFIAHRAQQSHCSWIFHRVLLTHALALSASQFVNKKNSYNEFVQVCTRRARTHETDLYQARGWPDTPPGRPAMSTHSLDDESPASCDCVRCYCSKIRRLIRVRVIKSAYTITATARTKKRLSTNKS